MRPYLLLISLLLLSTFGCQRESASVTPDQTAPSLLRETSTPTPVPATNFRLKQTAVTGNTSGLGPAYLATRYEYLQGRALRQAVIPIPAQSPNAQEVTSEYTYDDQGRVTTYLVRVSRPDDDGTVGMLYTFTYTANTIEWTNVRVRANGEKVYGLERDARNIFRLNAEGQVTEWIQDGIIRFGQPTTVRFLYTYENGNIVKVTALNDSDKVEFTLTYQYDDKVNPFYKWTDYPIDPILRSNRNNIVSSQYNNITPNITEYTYNENGLPVTKKDVRNGAVLTYEYEPF